MSGDVVPSPPQQQGHEPPMYLQRPSSGRSQDVSHVLARTFRELFTRDVIGSDTIRNLSVSKGGPDQYHERYVTALQKVHEERERRMTEATMLERHIMQAQARAMSSDERELNRIGNVCQGYTDLGLPPPRSHFRSCIDNELLKKHHLITPDDYATDKMPTVPPPPMPEIPDFARLTSSSTIRQSTKSGKSGRSGTVTPISGRLETNQLDLELEDHHYHSICSSATSAESLPKIADAEGAPSELRDGSKYWQSHMKEGQREIDRADLANLEGRSNFLRNPRTVPPSVLGGGRTLIKSHKKIPKDLGKQPKAEKPAKKEPSVVFLASPPVVTFSEYCVGRVYSLTLELKNITTAMRPVRVIPPTTPYFSVGLGQFPGEQGLVAPGMSCQYEIQFAPDSLGDYEDFVKVQTQSSTPLVIRVEGKREPPKLSLPECIDVGHCLVSGCRIAHYFVKNLGGPGKFCVMPKDVWPTTNFKMAVNPDGTILPPFQIRPSVFELGRNETILMEIVFTPPSIKNYSRTIAVVCDNCQVKYFTLTGEGQTAGVEFVDIDGGTCEAIPSEINDVTAQQLVKFQTLNPFTYVQKTMQVSNTTNVELPFTWKVVKPHFACPDPEKTEVEPPMSRVLDVDSAFSIEPLNGVLQPNGQASFLVTFAPPEVAKFHSILHMVLQHVPDHKEEEEQNGSRLPEPDLLVKDVTALEVELKGECEPLSVTVQPYGVYIPGKTLVGTTIRKQFMMTNHSISTIVFQWEPVTEGPIIEVEPPIGEIASMSTVELEVSLTGSDPGPIKETLRCFVENLEEPLHLFVEADIKGPEVIMDNADLNFGLVRLGNTVCMDLCVRNTCHIPAKWTIEESPACGDSENPMAESEFKFFPSSGELKPLESKKIEVQFKPSDCRSVHTVIELAVDDGNECNIQAFAEVQVPQVCLLSCQLMMEEVYLEVEMEQTITLFNQTLLETDFEWLEPEGSQASICSVSIDPKCGRLQPRQELPITIKFIGHRQGELSDVRLPCMVEGMESPLYLALMCDVQGLTVEYQIPDSAESGADSPVSEDTVSLDFGPVGLGECPKRSFSIKNNSAICAPFSVIVDHYFARPPSPPDTKEKAFMPNKGQRRAILSRTQNLASPTSKSPAKAHLEMCRMMLREGKGAAFAVNPPSGVLQPFGEQVIEVTGYSDMWGEYADKLQCKVEKLDVVEIPMKMSVTGCPLEYQMTAPAGNHTPILRFGTHVSGVAPSGRQVRVNNTSPFDVRVDWEVYNLLPDDDKLLDLVFTYGKPFPLKDKDGNEIEPPENDTTPRIQRLPTEMLPNSPDSSLPNPSRNPTVMSMAGLPTIHADRLKVISVKMRAHEGVQRPAPYHVTPDQAIIPAKGCTNFCVTFTPPSTDDVTQDSDCLSYALGFMSLADDVAGGSPRCSRLQALDVDPIRLEMTALVKPALLSLEPEDEDGMRYIAGLSDLFDESDGQLYPECVKSSSAMISNNTETHMSFILMVRPPFRLLRPSSQLTEDGSFVSPGEITIPPQKSIVVSVGFIVTKDLLAYADDREPDIEEDGITLTTTNGERKLHFKQNLVLKFNNRTEQVLPLYATLTIPSLQLSKTEVDFGTCLVGQERCQEFIISNKTASASYWTVMIANQLDTCIETTFMLSPFSGKLEAYLTYISDSQTIIKVYFTAKHSEAYEATFVFQGLLGEEPQYLTVRGEGSYDGKHEALVNV